MTVYGYDQRDMTTAPRIAHDLDEPRTRLGGKVMRTARITNPETGAVIKTRVDANVWHCSLSLRAE